MLCILHSFVQNPFALVQLFSILTSLLNQTYKSNKKILVNNHLPKLLINSTTIPSKYGHVRDRSHPDTCFILFRNLHIFFPLVSEVVGFMEAVSLRTSLHGPCTPQVGESRSEEDFFVQLQRLFVYICPVQHTFFRRLLAVYTYHTTWYLDW